ncbi:MAG: hypothetical protein K2N12_08810 [Helicobacter sp.]|nr:hypothetical protein [Helicobacter sp.]
MMYKKSLNKLVSVLRKKQPPITFSDDGKESFIQLFNDKKKEKHRVILKRISEALSSIAQNPEECELVEYPNGRLYKDKNKTENYLIRITFELLESICVKGIFYEDTRFLT